MEKLGAELFAVEVGNANDDWLAVGASVGSGIVTARRNQFEVHQNPNAVNAATTSAVTPQEITLERLFFRNSANFLRVFFSIF